MKRGNVAICLHDEDGNAVRCTLENTLFIPSYPQCIFSVQAATRSGARVNFDGSTAELITKDGTKFPVTQYQRLYYLYKNSVNPVRSESIQVWHKIMGHCNVGDLNKLKAVSQGMNITNSSSDFN